MRDDSGNKIEFQCEKPTAPSPPTEAAVPGRLAVVRWPNSRGHYQAAVMKFPCGTNEAEYISLQEHQAELLKQVRQARADSYRKAAERMMVKRDICIEGGELQKALVYAECVEMFEGMAKQAREEGK